MAARWLSAARASTSRSGAKDRRSCASTASAAAAHFFAALGAALQDRYRTIALDFPGAGFSPPLPRFSFDALADIVVELVGGREGAPGLCLIGHSMGTIVALEAFRRSPDLARGFIAVGGLSDPLPGARSRIAARAQEIRRNGMSGLGRQRRGGKPVRGDDRASSRARRALRAAVRIAVG